MDTHNPFPLPLSYQKKIETNTLAAPPQKPASGLANLPIGWKTQLITLLVIPALGAVGLIGQKVLENSLRSQLQNQTKSQLSVSKSLYENDLQNTLSSLISTAENPTLLTTVQTAQEIDLTQNILAQELRNRKLQYLTLFGKDGKILVNANNTVRQGQKSRDANQQALVNQVLNEGLQTTSTEIIRAQELQAEFGKSFGQDSLIRYTFNPVKDPSIRKVIGVLMSGEILNGKYDLVNKSIDANGGQGYSAIYLRQNPEKFSIVAALEKTDLRDSKRDTLLSQEAQKILSLADSSQGRVPEDKNHFRGQIVDPKNRQAHTYTLAAEPIPNHQGENVAIFVYGDDETKLNQVISTSFKTQLLSLIPLLLGIGGLAWLIGRNISKPVTALQEAALKFSRGNYQEKITVNSTDELGQLSHTLNEMADKIEEDSQYLKEQADMFRFLSRLSLPTVYESTNLDRFFNQVLKEARQIIAVDRLLVYRFYRDGRGWVAYESVAANWPSAINDKVEDACIPASLLEAYRQERSVVSGNIEEADFHPEHLRLLERLEVKATAILPIIYQGELYGLLVAHQCSAPRQWQETEVNFLRQFITQIQVTLERVNLQKQRVLESRLSARLKEITLNIARAMGEEELFDIAVKESRRALQTHRVIVYKFNPNWSGDIIAESVEGNFPEAKGARIADPCFAEKFVEKYRQGRVVATADIYAAGLTTCHLQQLEPFAVRANLVTPIVVGGELFGLLIAHYCSSTHDWEQAEIDFLTQVAVQVGVARERSNLLEQQQKAEQEQRREKEQLQERAIALLMEVDPIRQGDLSIRATVTNDEIGTIADAYNATIESLRRIVTQVQDVTQKLTLTTDDSEQSIHLLADQAKQQLTEIQEAFGQIETMMNALALVSDNSQQALVTVQETLNTVDTCDRVMNQTTDSMRSLQETVAQTTQKVYNLEESSQKISKVVSLIGRFAAQTHLLALKASIEAARAGEEGRGFAVIADEVRTLASQSAEATAEIASLVGMIQNETREVAKTMETGTEQVTEGSALVEETRQRLNYVTQYNQKVNELVEAIAASAVNQAQTGLGVRKTMTDVAVISQLTATSAQDVTVSFGQLLEAAKVLSESVGQFKVH
jgi:methyl-accepting chemotaxis protein PixJ